MTNEERIMKNVSDRFDERHRSTVQLVLGPDGQRLYDAAPDLLAALQSFLAAMDSDFHDLMLAKLQAQKAIAKAKGTET